MIKKKLFFPKKKIQNKNFFIYIMSSNKSFNYCVPEKIIKRIYELINQVRLEYNLNPLQFNKELSFIAGEHACNMSTKSIEFGHSGFETRMNQSYLSLTFSENISFQLPCEDPAKLIVVSWLKKSSSFSRIIGEFSHTGIGISESEEGNWYCTQIYSLILENLNEKDELLISSRLINRYRTRHNLNHLSIGINNTFKLLSVFKDKPDLLHTLTTTSIKNYIPNFIDIDIIMDHIPNSNDIIFQFFQLIRERPNFVRIIKKDFTEVGFLKLPTKDSQFICLYFFLKNNSPFINLPNLSNHYILSIHALQIINEFRILFHTTFFSFINI